MYINNIRELTDDDFLSFKNKIQYNDYDTYQFVIAYMNGCGWCEKAKPLVLQLNSLSKNHVFTVAAIDGVNNRIPRQLGIRGFPSFFLIKKDGEIITYDGNRKIEDIFEFIDKNVI